MPDLTESRIEFLYRISKFIIQAKIHDIDLLCFGYYHTIEQDRRYFQEGKSHIDPDKHPTKHMVWLAMDFVVFKDGKCIWDRVPEYGKLAEIAREVGLFPGYDWGIEFSDPYHFEFPEWG